MKYVVYMKEGTMSVKSKGLALSQGLSIICEFNNFYSAVEFTQVGE